MTTNGNPSEIARETLRQLAMRRVAPTPDNYRKLYHEIAGTSTSEDAPPESDLAGSPVASHGIRQNASDICASSIRRSRRMTPRRQTRPWSATWTA